ncbi:AglZ/HisF2 family acetamidino modification protein [Schleiferiaceae bacterium]|nr:AglZ/HisF2 family acetamidino modification protein [Schleiferiaceae bacterium]
MRRVRIIPTLLLDGNSLVKTKRFRAPTYIGDPLNAVKIFNEKEVDEIVLLDIFATKNGLEPNYTLINEIAGECFMPLAYGGGIKSMKHAERLFKCGIEKIILNFEAVNNPKFITDLANKYGSQAIVVSIDVKKNFFGKYSVFTGNGTKNMKLDPLVYAKRCEELGAGEIFLTSIDMEGMMQGYDLEITQNIAASLNIPLVASGGAGSLDDMTRAVNEGLADAVAAGSLFVYHGKLRGVLINIPTKEIIERDVFNKI